MKKIALAVGISLVGLASLAVAPPFASNATFCWQAVASGNSIYHINVCDPTESFRVHKRDIGEFGE